MTESVVLVLQTDLAHQICKEAFAAAVLVFGPKRVRLVLGDKAEWRHRAFVAVDLLIVGLCLDLVADVFQLLLVVRLIGIAFTLGHDRESHQLLQAIELLFLHLRVLGEPL